VVKLIVQIALGVFLGTLASQLTIDAWHTHRENVTKATSEQLKIQQEKIRKEQGERIRNLILQNRLGVTPNPSQRLPDEAK
jgi:hypothetical protein